MINVTLVDDHEIVRKGVKTLVECEPDIHIVNEFSSPTAALNADLSGTDVMIYDLHYVGCNGLDYLKQLFDKNPALKIIVFTMFEPALLGTSAIKLGVSAYLNKGSDLAHLILAIRQVALGQLYIPPDLAQSISRSVSQGFTNRGYQNLSAREKEILQLISAGKRLSEISDLLVISIKTVSSHRRNILNKLELKTNADLVKFSLMERLF